ncbi:beta-N-acetylglucosaminidase domain-containing protein [Micromonospora sp. NPDC050187]|uniref:beta-N-acetylglucosaminidase domain-containing protein n=1 Tax=Micromonospora sp. NPDC050187 TaxID=3364277 RepID=UPI0037BD7D92
MSAAPPSASPAGRGAALPLRGTVEGFYGPPWSPAERLAHLEFSALVGLNTYVYAPKNDPYHRARWRDTYPADELRQLAALAERARSLDIRFVYAISPGLTMRFADDADHRALAAKTAALWDAGVESFALFFDDVPTELSRPEERDRWPGAGAAHGEACTRFVADVLTPRGIREPLLVCPTDYAGTDTSAYRQQFAETAPPEVVVAWTGPDIVVGAITREDVDRAAASYRRPLVLWDNYPVNDYEPSRLFLGPLTGRATDLAGSALVGVLANPMVQAVPSRIPLASVADWARDPGRYDPAVSARRALATVAGAGAGHLEPLVRACSAWPPSAAQDPELLQAMDDALAGSPAALDVLTTRLDELARGCAAAAEPEPLVTALRPWLTAGASGARAGLAAVRLLRSATSDLLAEGGSTTGRPTATPTASDQRIEALREEAGLALAEAESHHANLLRPVIPPFVREVLRRTAPAPAGTDARPYVLLVTGDRPTAGDQVVAGLCERHGYRVRPVGTPSVADLDQAVAVVVTRGADGDAIDAVARVGVPLLAWHGLVPLGLARGSAVLLLHDKIRIVAPDDPVAAGFHGHVPVYRGPGKLTVAEIGPQARVVARVTDEDRAALFHYAAGAELADGSPAPARRIGVFLSVDGPAPWLVTPEGHALVSAAVDALFTRIPRQAGPAAVRSPVERLGAPAGTPEGRSTPAGG